MYMRVIYMELSEGKRQTEREKSSVKKKQVQRRERDQQRNKRDGER